MKNNVVLRLLNIRIWYLFSTLTATKHQCKLSLCFHHHQPMSDIMLYLCLNSQWQHNYLPSHTAHSMAETESTQQGWCKQPCNEYWQSSRPDALSTSSRTHQCQWPVLKSVTSHCMPTILKILPATSTIHPSSKWIWISKKIKFYKSKFELENKPNLICVHGTDALWVTAEQSASDCDIISVLLYSDCHELICQCVTTSLALIIML